MAILVVGIHTGPFEFNIWLDRAFGLITRFCVPFFFVISAFFFFVSEKPLSKYLIRNLILYISWVVIYCCFGLKNLSELSMTEILRLFLWSGYGVTWYLLATIYATILIYGIYKYCSVKKTIWCACILYLIGCLLSSWSPILRVGFGLNVENIAAVLGFRNGLFYAPIFIAIGLWLSVRKKYKSNITRNILGFILSFTVLIVETVVLVIYFKTKSTILFLATVPATYFLCNMVLNTYVEIPKYFALIIRKISVFVYFIHPIVNHLFKLYGWNNSFSLFLVVSVCSCFIGYLLIKISKKITFIKYLA